MISNIPSKLNVSSDRIIQWMNVLRETSGAEQYRLLENFWASQLKSKAWLVNAIKLLKLLQTGNVYIFGGWYGVLASLIKDHCTYNQIYSIDIDATCESFGNRLDDRITFISSDMLDIKEHEIINAGLIINTSTEHITQETYDQWLSNLPLNVPIILQGNNFFECKEHLRCTKDLSEFVKCSKLHNIVFQGELDCEQFTRFMIIGYKNDNN